MGFKVRDEYRTNPLSLRPGGYTICVEMLTGEVREYDKIKNPIAYMRTLEGKHDVKDAWVKSS